MSDQGNNYRQLLKEMQESGADPNMVKRYECLYGALEQIQKDIPPGGYGPAIKKGIKRAFFRPKTNWAMLGTLVGLAGLLAMVLLSK